MEKEDSNDCPLRDEFYKIARAIERSIGWKFYSVAGHDAERIGGVATAHALNKICQMGYNPVEESKQWEKLARYKAKQMTIDLLRHRISVGKAVEESFLGQSDIDEDGEERETSSVLLDASAFAYAELEDREGERELTKALKDQALRIIKNTIGLTLEAQVFISRIIREESVERVAKRFRIPEQKVSDYTFKVKKLLIRYNKFNLAA